MDQQTESSTPQKPTIAELEQSLEQDPTRKFRLNTDGTIDPDTDYACFAKAKENHEITFTLRAQDQSAPDVIDFWAAKNALVLGHEHPKIVQARQIAARMRVFPGRRQAD